MTKEEREKIFEEIISGLRKKFIHSDKEHQSEKPVALLEKLIEITLQDAIVLDPFMGSGTTGVVCAKLGRKFIGIEIEERYFQIACERIQKAYDQPDFFIEPHCIPCYTSHPLF